MATHLTEMLNSKSLCWRLNSYTEHSGICSQSNARTLHTIYNHTPSFAYVHMGTPTLGPHPPWNSSPLEHTTLGEYVYLKAHHLWDHTHTHTGTTPTLGPHPPWDHTHLGTTPTLGPHPP